MFLFYDYVNDKTKRTQILPKPLREKCSSHPTHDTRYIVVSLAADRMARRSLSPQQPNVNINRTITHNSLSIV